MRVRSVSREEVWASAGVQGAWVGGCGCEAVFGAPVTAASSRWGGLACGLLPLNYQPLDGRVGMRVRCRGGELRCDVEKTQLHHDEHLSGIITGWAVWCPGPPDGARRCYRRMGVGRLCGQQRTEGGGLYRSMLEHTAPELGIELKVSLMPDPGDAGASTARLQGRLPSNPRGRYPGHGPSSRVKSERWPHAPGGNGATRVASMTSSRRQRLQQPQSPHPRQAEARPPRTRQGPRQAATSSLSAGERQTKDRAKRHPAYG